MGPTNTNKILVVEDDPVGFYLLKELLLETGKEIVHKKDGLEAMNYINKNHDKIDLIIMDIILPKQDGIITTELVRKNNWNIPIIAISADVSESNKIKCYKAGCDTFYTKPIDIPKFLTTINKYLSVSA